ncbi:uncharacterized protein LOC120989971 [Bufo bufo]|uniref:uncharacterized protein LOC120989971 n=1 Tax=Bufo bufo TaxID=8384 RepID=UPI001ABDC580|nr:uncharacterized protein LOC120989971 [Bufo bufo]
MIMTTNPTTSLPYIQNHLQQYSSISNFKINASKSLILTLGISTHTKSLLMKNSPFNWSCPTITYLGVKISPQISDLFSLNYIPLKNSLFKAIDNLQTRAPMLSWFGRKNLLTSLILPRLTYLQQVLPIPIPSSFYTSLKQKFRTFIWNGKKARLSYKLLAHPRQLGGIGLPDPELYGKAILLARAVDWLRNPTDKPSVSLEQSILGIPFRAALLGHHFPPHIPMPNFPILKATLDAWRWLNSSHCSVPFPSPILTVADILGTSSPILLQSSSKRIKSSSLPIRNLLDSPGKLLETDAIYTLLNPCPCDLTLIPHIRSFLMRNNTEGELLRPIGWFEALIINPKPLRKLISQIHSKLRTPPLIAKPSFIHNWERETGITIPISDLPDLFDIPHKAS